MLWHEAQLLRSRCLSNSSRKVLALLSGSTPGVPGGGGEGVIPRIRSKTYTPRTIGEVFVPLAETFRHWFGLENPRADYQRVDGLYESSALDTGIL